MTAILTQSGQSDVLSVAIKIANATELRKLNQSYSLVEIIQELCLDLKLPYQDGQYALQLQCKLPNLDYIYITEVNRHEIKNGSILSLVFSPSEMAKVIIHKLNNGESESGETSWALEKLQGLVSDPSFAEEFYIKGGIPIICSQIVDPSLPFAQLANCLSTLDRLLEHKLHTVIENNVVDRIANFIIDENIPAPYIVAPCLSILSRLANAGNEYVTHSVQLSELVPHIWNQENELILTNALAFMNSMARSNRKVCSSMASKHMKETIANNILKSKIHPESSVAQELYDYQTLILSFKELKFHTVIDPTGKDLQNVQELDRVVIAVDSGSSRHSIESLLDDHILPEAHTSKVKPMQDISLPKRKIARGGRSRSFLWPNSVTTEPEPVIVPRAVTLNLTGSESSKPISRLTLDCMVYFARNYPKQYIRMLLAEEASWQPFPVTCQCLVKLIADVMGITKVKKLNVKMYQPLIFREPAFVEEVFCRIFLQLGRTRQDMRARTAADEDKVIHVLQRQLFETLKQQPGSLKDFTKELRYFNYEKISELWLQEWTDRDNKISRSKPILELKETRREEITAVIRQQRINVLLKGNNFPIYGSRHHKLKKRSTFVVLSSNQKSFHFHDCDEDGRALPDTSGKKSLAEISTVLVGKKCPHVIKELKTNAKAEYELAFSLIPDLASSFDLYAPDQETFDYWTDGVNAILGKEMKSATYVSDLEKLLDMEIRLQMLELKGVKIPKMPPPIPPPPDNYDFTSNK